MCKVNRCIIPWHFQKLTTEFLDILISLNNQFDETIIVIRNGEKAFTKDALLSAGERMERLSAVFYKSFKKPYYILPIKENNLSDIQLLYRLKAISPSFNTIVIKNDEDEYLYSKAFKCNIIKVQIPSDGFSVYQNPKQVKRGLFLTRAQFFHKGHAAFIEQMEEEMDEIIIAVAMANLSHTVDNPATAGERIEIIKLYLEKSMRKKYYLASAPYEPFIAVNFDELKLFFPRFDYVYSNNPTISELAKYSGLEVIRLKDKIHISATDLRKRIISGMPYKHLVPIEVSNAIGDSPAFERLMELSKAEDRG